MEGLALTGAWVDRERGLLSLIVLEMGVSSRLVAALKPGEPVVVMGPTGSPTEIPHGETVILCGGGLGNAVLFSIARALRASGDRVIYFAGYKKAEDLFNQDQKLDEVDWKNLNSRLRQNTVAEKLANLWLDHLLAIENVIRV